MAAIAKRLVLREAAAAKRYDRSTGEIEVLALTILDHEVSRNSKWSVGVADNGYRFVH